jgi:O-antigen/teichoic acid export membrane protein
VGVSQVGPEVVYWFLGIGYWEAGIAIHILAFTIPVIGLRYSLALQQMAIERDFSSTSVQVQTGAVINIVLTLILIPSFGIRGAAVSALLSEGIALSLQYFSLRQTLKIGDVLSGGWRFLIAGLITYVGLGKLIQVFYYSWPTFSYFEAALGGLIYLVVLAMLFIPNFVKLNK